MTSRSIYCNALVLLLGLALPSLGYGADLVLHYTFDEGSGNAVSDSAGPYHGEMQGSGWAWDPEGVFGSGSVAFGNNGRVVSDPQVWADLPGSSVTVTVWLNMNAAASTPWVGHVFFAGNSFPPMLAGRFWATSLSFWPEWGAWGIADAQAGLTGKWHHYAFVKDFQAGTKTIYLDGEQVFTHADTSPIEGVPAFSLGAGVSAGNEPLEARMDEFRIYDGVLTPDEVRRTMVATFPQASVRAPGDGAVDVAPEGRVLSWNPGDFAAAHDVYFGTDPVAVSNAVAGDPTHLGTQIESTYALDRLDLGQTYYSTA